MRCRGANVYSLLGTFWNRYVFCQFPPEASSAPAATALAGQPASPPAGLASSWTPEATHGLLVTHSPRPRVDHSSAEEVLPRPSAPDDDDQASTEATNLAKRCLPRQSRHFASSARERTPLSQPLCPPRHPQACRPPPRAPRPLHAQTSPRAYPDPRRPSALPAPASPRARATTLGAGPRAPSLLPCPLRRVLTGGGAGPCACAERTVWRGRSRGVAGSCRGDRGPLPPPVLCPWRSPPRRGRRPGFPAAGPAELQTVPPERRSRSQDVADGHVRDLRYEAGARAGARVPGLAGRGGVLGARPCGPGWGGRGRRGADPSAGAPAG